MACPIIHTTPEAKLAAACEKRRRYYANVPDSQACPKRHKDLILQRRRQLRPPKRDMKESRKMLKAISKALHGSDSDEDSKSESSDDESSESSDTDNLSNLTQCLFALKIIKDEMLTLTDDPCAFVQSVFSEYVKTLDGSVKGDVTILEKPMATGRRFTQARNSHPRSDS
ncbi:hypothetical protein EV424DRAFT_1346251 [Suillus variegatus]|nr:hypothetical protein EV424DRAFT_1346251 [Suillus variegatus]